jgi:hypothetical protein
MYCVDYYMLCSKSNLGTPTAIALESSLFGKIIFLSAAFS